MRSDLNLSLHWKGLAQTVFGIWFNLNICLLVFTACVTNGNLPRRTTKGITNLQRIEVWLGIWQHLNGTFVHVTRTTKFEFKLVQGRTVHCGALRLRVFQPRLFVVH